MKLKALKSFAGKTTMYAGEVREVLDEAIAKDLIRAGYAVEVKAEKVVTKPAEKPAEEPADKPAKSGGKRKKSKK